MDTPASAVENIERRLSHIEAKEQIRDVLYQYCRAADRRDIELFKSCYHPDSTDNHGFYIGNGWEFADYVFPILNQLDLCIHSLSNPIIKIDENKALVETQWFVIHRLRRWFGITDLCHNGRYLDIFEKRDGQWKILHRMAVLDAERWLNTADLQKFIPDSHPNKQHTGKNNKSDYSYNISSIPVLSNKQGHINNVWGGIRLSLLLPTPLLHLFGRLFSASKINFSKIYT